jgi:iron complex outermembrane receptor protein
VIAVIGALQAVAGTASLVAGRFRRCWRDTEGVLRRARMLGNTLAGQSDGVEAGVNVQPVPWWRSHAGYTWLNSQVRRQPGSRDLSGGLGEANDPHHLFNARTSFDLSRQVEVDALVRAVSALPNPAIPGYAELTLRLGWRPRPGLELSVVGQDLLHDHHLEVGGPPATRVEFERSVRTALTVAF